MTSRTGWWVWRDRGGRGLLRTASGSLSDAQCAYQVSVCVCVCACVCVCVHVCVCECVCVCEDKGECLALQPIKWYIYLWGGHHIGSLYTSHIKHEHTWWRHVRRGRRRSVGPSPPAVSPCHPSVTPDTTSGRGLSWRGSKVTNVRETRTT